MTPRTIVLNLGMPRSGTTLIQKMFERGTGYAHQKICEFHEWHPMNGARLWRLVNTFRHKRVVVVRTARGRQDIEESMRVGAEMGNPHSWSSEEIKRLWIEERTNFTAFLTAVEDGTADIDPSVDCRVVAFGYHELADLKRRATLLRRIARHVPDPAVNRSIWGVYLDDVWGTKPVNVGRLMREKGDGS